MRQPQGLRTLGLSQTDVVKAGLALLQRQRQSPAALAEALALVGLLRQCRSPRPAWIRGPRPFPWLKQTLRQRQQAQRIGT